MSEQDGHVGAADAGEASDGVTALVAALDDADELDAEARLELLRRIEAGIAAELDGLDGL